MISGKGYGKSKTQLADKLDSEQGLIGETISVETQRECTDQIAIGVVEEVKSQSGLERTQIKDDETSIQDF